MMPPFTFLKNLHNHNQKTGKSPATPSAPSEPATDKAHKIRGKLTKSAKGRTQQAPYISPTARLVETEDPQTFHQRENRSPTQPLPQNGSHYGTTQGRVLDMHNHISSPPLPHHIQRKVDHQTNAVIPQSTPVASQYMSSAHRYPQGPAAIPIALSRSWSPIPSVHRESIRDDSELEEFSRSDVYEGRSWVNRVHHAVPELEGSFYDDAKEIPTLRKEPNIVSPERTYIDYSMARLSKPESQKSFSNLKQQDENVIRRQRSQWNDHPPETIEVVYSVYNWGGIMTLCS
ncbi:hypothetical protein M413DRAFT_309588 [Hebeloma cylindrosporum]|uniref:Uncharacterized protein n=1 Tax=Hebeloma cylindrosporum TaxID=76867 RepID=A0A0C3CQ91_HEBCY|nr:hypothetical protein M413DRAFT_309588 [Hebeloma cylindrosporum h7]